MLLQLQLVTSLNRPSPFHIMVSTALACHDPPRRRAVWTRAWLAQASVTALAGGVSLRCALRCADCQSVLVGSSSLALWNVAEQKRIGKFVGHSVRILFF
jgi:hypothetical protein